MRAPPAQPDQLVHQGLRAPLVRPVLSARLAPVPLAPPVWLVPPAPLELEERLELRVRLARAGLQAPRVPREVMEQPV
jgi:hypothetical protein